MKQQLGMPTSHMWDTHIPYLSASLSPGRSTSDLASCKRTWMAAEDSLRTAVVATHVGDVAGVPGCCLQRGPAPAGTNIWRVNWYMKACSHQPPTTIVLNKQTKK